MGAPTDVSRPARGLPANDVLFLASVAFVFFALIVTIAVIRH